jgi:plastocyanin
MARYLSILALTGLLAFAGCGGSSKSSKSKAAASSSSAAQTNGDLGKLTLKNIAFHPKTASVKVGHRVTWTNEEDVMHNVTAVKGASFKSKLFGKDGSFSYTPTKVGTIKYTCTVHPGMDGTLNVTK